LIARQYSLPEICAQIGADSLGFLELNSLGEMLGDIGRHYCDACFSVIIRRSIRARQMA
jgi:amidophosphoribosyltransferase